MESQSSFALHFPNDKRCWTFVIYLLAIYTSFEKYLFHSFAYLQGNFLVVFFFFQFFQVLIPCQKGSWWSFPTILQAVSAVCWFFPLLCRNFNSVQLCLLILSIIFCAFQVSGFVPTSLTHVGRVYSYSQFICNLWTVCGTRHQWVCSGFFILQGSQVPVVAPRVVPSSGASSPTSWQWVGSLAASCPQEDAKPQPLMMQWEQDQQQPPPPAQLLVDMSSMAHVSSGHRPCKTLNGQIYREHVLVVASGQGGKGSDQLCGISFFLDNENVPELIVILDAQLYEYTKCQ